ncbi:MAG: hypothetical protein ABSF32_10775 [Ignavibacteria bacterium]
MKSYIKSYTALITVMFLFFIGFTGCQKKENKVLIYLQNSELHFDSKVQRDNVFQAMKDCFIYSEDELKTRRYKDYTGKDGQWDLPQVLSHHFAPKKDGLTLGDDVYHDVKEPEVQVIFLQLLGKY